MTKYLRLLAALTLAATLLACSDETEQTSENSPASPAVASADGGSVSFTSLNSAGLDELLAAHAGKPAVAFFWTTWCPSCKDQLPDMEALFRSHGDKMQVLSISLDERKDALETFFQKNSLDMPVHHGDMDLARRLNISSIPTVVIFDKAGEQVFARSGVFPHSMLEAMADKVLQ